MIVDTQDTKRKSTSPPTKEAILEANKENYAMVSLRISTEQMQDIKSRAKSEKRSISNYIKSKLW
jgi:hypothetical protein